MRLSYSFVLVCLVFLPGLSNGSSALDLQPIGRREFFEQQVGKIAIFDTARTKSDAQHLTQFHFFPQSGEYQLDRSLSSIWFAVNHVVRQDISDDSEAASDFDPTYLGVQILSAYDATVSPSANVFLFRNRNWVRNNDVTFSTGDFSKAFANRSITEFVDEQKLGRDIKLADFDRLFAKWHGQVAADADNSWEFRSDWVISDLPSVPNLALKNYLIRFTPTTNADTYKYVFFSTRIDNVTAMRIRTFAPTAPGSDAFDNDIRITFKK